MLKHNSYFEGGVQSIGFERNGRRQTVGVMAPGEYHWDVSTPERIVVVSGELWVRLNGGDFVRYAAGTAFEVPANASFDVRAERAAGYHCEFL
jgi:hypothetical protein